MSQILGKGKTYTTHVAKRNAELLCYQTHIIHDGLLRVYEMKVFDCRGLQKSKEVCRKKAVHWSKLVFYSLCHNCLARLVPTKPSISMTTTKNFFVWHG